MLMSDSVFAGWLKIAYVDIDDAFAGFILIDHSMLIRRVVIENIANLYGVRAPSAGGGENSTQWESRCSVRFRRCCYIDGRNSDTAIR